MTAFILEAAVVIVALVVLALIVIFAFGAMHVAKAADEQADAIREGLLGWGSRDIGDPS